MPRALNTYDAFTAIAEPKRRELMETLVGRELSVNQVVGLTKWNQPMVSKHLGVLKEAGLVSERKEGRQRIYSVNADQLKPIQIWIAQFQKHWNTKFDQLDNYLTELQTKGPTMNEEIFVEPSILTKDYKAPMLLVYNAWTHEQRLCKWQIQNKEIVCEYKFSDIRSGGSALHKMTMPNGNEMWLLTKYHELTPPDTIVFTQYESNENGDIVSPRMANWPKEIRASIKLSESNGVTNMQFIWQPINPTPEEAEAWEASRSQHGKGWRGGFEMLAIYLATIDK